MLANSIRVSTTSEYCTSPLVTVYKDDVVADTFRINTNGNTDKIFRHNSDSIVYVVSFGGSARVGYVTKVNFVAKTFEYLEYEAWGYSDSELVGDKYVVSCKTNPMHSDTRDESYQWTDTMDVNCNFISSSDTVTVTVR